MTETRKTYESGAERSTLDTERFDLISPIALRRLAQTYAEGAAKYDDHNWRKGFPTSSLLNHVLAHLCNYAQGISPDNEDELAHAAWGLFALIEQETTHPELDDRWKFVSVTVTETVVPRCPQSYNYCVMGGTLTASAAQCRLPEGHSGFCLHDVPNCGGFGFNKRVAE